MDFANEIKERISMDEILEMYGFSVDKKGFICCPFHSEKTPSFKSYSGSKGYHCFGCGEHGGVIDFVMKYYNLKFSEAISKINADFCLGLPIGEKLNKRQMLNIEKNAYFRRKKIKDEQKRKEEIRANYWNAFDEWMILKMIIDIFFPLSPDDEPIKEFTEALQKISYQEYLLDLAENEVRKLG